MAVITKMLFSSLLIIATVFFIHLQVATSPKNNEAVQAASPEEISESVQESPLKLNVTLRRVYLDGEISEEKVSETVLALEDFWAKYEAWQLVDMNENMMLFELKIDDISPLLKLNGFFGIANDGTLSIFNGNPQQDDIIQSFFQIDIRKLEGKKQLQLKQGIPVKTKKDFVEVLETMKQYSVDIE